MHPCQNIHCQKIDTALPVFRQPHSRAPHTHWLAGCFWDHSCSVAFQSRWCLIAGGHSTCRRKWFLITEENKKKWSGCIMYINGCGSGVWLTPWDYLKKSKTFSDPIFCLSAIPVLNIESQSHFCKCSSRQVFWGKLTSDRYTVASGVNQSFTILSV